LPVFSLVKILAVLVMMVVLIARKVNLGLALLTGAALLGLLAPFPLLETAKVMGLAAVKLPTLHLVVAIYLVVLLGLIMKHTRCFAKTVDALAVLFPDKRVSLAAIPSLIGLLPVLGGAMLSAPMIGEIGEELKMSPENKTFINYWFRHVWEYIWPLYPGVILTAGLLDVSVFQLAAHQLPLTAAAITGGVLLGLRQVGPGSEKPAQSEGGRRRPINLLFQGISPILLVVLFVFGLRLDIVPALGLTLITVAALLRISFSDIWQLAKEAFSVNTVFVVVGVMAFKDAFEAAGLAGQVTEALAGLGVPPAIFIFVMPFLVGLMTGVTQAFVAITFPLLLAWFRPGDICFPAVLLAYAGGFSGVLFSPVHFCLVLTREYFHADLRKVYGLIARPVSLVVLVALSAYIVF